MPRNFKLFILALLGLLAWYAIQSRGKPVPKGSYADRARDFSLLPPEGWLFITPENQKEAAALPGLVLPEPIRADLAKGRIAASFIRKAAPKQVAPSIHLLVLEGGIPRLNRDDMERLVRLIDWSVEGASDTHRHESLEIIDVDGIRSLKVTGRASDLMLSHALVRGAKKAYVLTMTCPETEKDACDETFTALLASFRVLRRPPLF